MVVRGVRRGSPSPSYRFGTRVVVSPLPPKDVGGFVTTGKSRRSLPNPRVPTRGVSLSTTPPPSCLPSLAS